MVTTKKLDSYCRKYLSGLLTSKGFYLGKRKCTFVRDTGSGVFHFVTVTVSGGGRHARMFVIPLVEAALPKANRAGFPDGDVIAFVGGVLSDRGIGVGDYVNSDISQESDAERFFLDVARDLESHGVPFLDAVTSPAQFVAHISEYPKILMAADGRLAEIQSLIDS